MVVKQLSLILIAISAFLINQRERILKDGMNVELIE